MIKDHYICNNCGYEWRTRKDIGKPSICPNCKKHIIKNLSNQMKIETELEEKYSKDYSKKHVIGEFVARVGIKKHANYSYFIDKNGDVVREKEGIIQRVAIVRIKKERGFIYFIDDSGHISRIRFR